MNEFSQLKINMICLEIVGTVIFSSWWLQPLKWTDWELIDRYMTIMPSWLHQLRASFKKTLKSNDSNMIRVNFYLKKKPTYYSEKLTQTNVEHLRAITATTRLKIVETPISGLTGTSKHLTICKVNHLLFSNTCRADILHSSGDIYVIKKRSRIHNKIYTHTHIQLVWFFICSITCSLVGIM